MSAAAPEVALFVETSLGSGRDILLGIARYVREHQPWSLYHEPRSLEDRPPPWLKGWRGSGIIARVQTPAMARAIAQTGVPVVDVLGVVPESGFPLVHVDNEAIGRLAAQHLLERSFRSFAFLGIDGENWSDARQHAFAQEVTAAGHPIAIRNESRHDVEDTSWDTHQHELAHWLTHLSKPVGIMVCSDQRGSQLLDACRRAGRRVPEEVAVIGVDNDEPLCSVCNPPLSSVWPGHAQVGYEAAALLHRLMQGEKRTPTRILIPPRKILTRQSTDVTAVDDPLVAHALRVIRQRATERIRIDEIASLVGVSRSVLQRRFTAALGHTLNHQLISQRLKVAQLLLRETQLPLLEIAERAGFQHQEYLGAVFKEHFSMTPAQYRHSRSD